MLCPECRTKLKCYDSRPLDDHTRYRLYSCPNCEEKFSSIENMDIPKSKKKPDF